MSHQGPRMLAGTALLFIVSASCESNADGRAEPSDAGELVDTAALRAEADETKIQTKLSEGREYRDRLLAEFERTGTPDWAQQYSWGNGFERKRLILCPAGFYFEYSHCTGTSSLAYGEVESVDGAAIRLAPVVWLDDPERPSDGGRSRFRLRRELYVVPWNNVRFVVPLDLMPEFCSMIRAEGRDAMRHADYPYHVVGGGYRFPWEQQKSFAGVPDVPRQYRQYLPDDARPVDSEQVPDDR